MGDRRRDFQASTQPFAPEGMVCLVTGAAGFIGSHLAERLLRDGHTVRAIDRLSPYYPIDLKKENLARVRAAGDFEFLEADLADCDVHPLLEEVDIVFHLAAQAGVRVSWGREFETYLRDNILATQRLLEAARDAPLHRFVLASSSSIYGDADSFPVHEIALPHPRSPYGVTKAAVEHLSGAYHAQFGVPTVALRYFTVFGPGQRPDMAFNRFIDRALVAQPIAIYGDGTQRRDFTYISDAVEATVSAGWQSRTGEVYNVAGGSHASVSDVIDALGELMDCAIAVEHAPVMPGDVKETHASVEKACRDLKYRPKVALLDGLSEQIKWQQAKIGSIA